MIETNENVCCKERTTSMVINSSESQTRLRKDKNSALYEVFLGYDISMSLVAR